MLRLRPRRHTAFSKGSAGKAALAVCVLLLTVAALHVALLYSNRPLPQCLDSMREQLAEHSRAALAGSWDSKVTFQTSTAAIPMQLWQTSRSRRLNKLGKELRSSWTQLNPQLPAALLDDRGAASFISSWYGPDVAAIYNAFPLAVMRADFWRYAVLYAQGGIYADIDTRCVTPVSAWFPPRHPSLAHDPVFVANASNWASAGTPHYFDLRWRDCALVTGLENDAHLCQWILAAAPGHPVLRAVLRLSLESVQQGFDCTYEHMVHKHTGPAIWTRSVATVLGLKPETPAADIAKAAWTEPAVYQRARQLKVCIVAHTFWGAPAPYNTTPQNAHNVWVSRWTQGNPNAAWTKERARLRAAVLRSSSGSSIGRSSSSQGRD